MYDETSESCHKDERDGRWEGWKACRVSKHVQPHESCLDNVNKNVFRSEGALRCPEPCPWFGVVLV